MLSTEALSVAALSAATFSVETFSIETIDGCRLGHLRVPCTRVADWLNFLATPQYRAALVFAEQCRETIDLYFEAGEGVYLYLDARLNQSSLPLLVS